MSENLKNIGIKDVDMVSSKDLDDPWQKLTSMPYNLEKEIQNVGTGSPHAQFRLETDTDFWDGEKRLYHQIVNFPPSVRNSLLLNSKPIEQVKYLSLLCRYALESEAYGMGVPDPLKVRDTLQKIKNNEKMKPLVKLEAEHFDNLISDYSDMLYDGDFDMVEEDSKTEKTIKLPDEENAKDKLDEEAKFLIDTVYDPDVGIEGLINKKLGLDISEVPLDSQVQLLKFMTEADNGRFNYLCDTLHKINGRTREKVLENFFLVRDFGEDFGDMLLAIANSNHINEEQAGNLLEKFDSCRKSIEQIVNFYKWFDNGELSEQFARAATERITDAVTVFREIAKNKIATADLGWAGHPKFDFDSAMEALGYETRALEIIGGTIYDIMDAKDGVFVEKVLRYDPSRARTKRSLYSLYSPDYGYVLLYTRPEASHSFDPMLEYGKVRSKYDENSTNAGIEASISLITDPINPFSPLNPFRPDRRALKNPRFYDSSKMDKVSAIRLDREGHAPNTSADDPNRDPINSIGMISVDLAAIGDRADTPSGKIARLLSVGNKIRADKMGEKTSLNHNTKWFDQDKYGTAEGFARIVEHIDRTMLRLANIYPPKIEESLIGKRRKIGKFALNSVVRPKAEPKVVGEIA